MTTTKEQAIIDRQQYIKRAKITFAGDYARVTSQFDENRNYPVRVVDGKANRCECDDFFYRGRKTGQACKHMQAVDLRIEKDAARAARKAAKAAKSAAIVASLQVAEGTKIRKARGQAVLVVTAPAEQIAQPVEEVQAEVPAETTKVEEMKPLARKTPTPHLVTGGLDKIPLLAALIEPRKPVPSGVRGNLSSNRGFSLMR